MSNSEEPGDDETAPVDLPRRTRSKREPGAPPQGFEPVGGPDTRPSTPPAAAAKPPAGPSGPVRRPDDKSVEPTASPDGFGPLTPSGPSMRPTKSGGPSAPRGPNGPRSRLTSSASARTSAQATPASPGPASPGPATPDRPSISEVSPVVPPRRARLNGAVAVVVALLVALGAGAVIWILGGHLGDQTESVAQGAGEAPTATEFDPPVVLAVDAEYVETEVRNGDHLLVTHWIRTGVPMGKFSINVPTGPEINDLEVDVRRLVVAQDGERIDLDGTDILGADIGSGAAAARDLYVQYELYGVLQRSGSAEGRALAVMTDLNIHREGLMLSKTQTFVGSPVLTLACLAQGPRAIPKPCGTYEDGMWSVVSDPGTVPAAVIAQLDLSSTR